MTSPKGSLPPHPADGAIPPAVKPHWAPAITLLLLAPIIAEVLLGATRVSVIFVLIPEIMVWGGGALMIREAVRRWHAGWPSMILMGIALAVAEECMIQQTSLAPLIGAPHVYGRFLGVNWVYLFALMVYECVWVVLVPVELTELIFPTFRRQPWIGMRGLAVFGIMFVLGAYIAWYAWTQRARPKVFHVPIYNPPLLDILIALGVITLLVTTAFRVRTLRLASPNISWTAPRPWLTGLATFLMALPCFLLTGIAYGAAPHLPFWIPMTGGIVWAILSLMLLQRWVSSPTWSVMHRFALVFGALLGNMASGYLILASGALLIDWIGKIVLNIVAVVFMIVLARKLRLRAAH